MKMAMFVQLLVAAPRTHALLPSNAGRPALIPRGAGRSTQTAHVQRPLLEADAVTTPSRLAGAGLAASSLALLSSAPAEAATYGANAVPSALAAYGHFLGLLLIAMCLITERILIKEDMSEEDFDLVAITDGAYGIAGVLVTITGYLRVTQYAKVRLCVHPPHRVYRLQATCEVHSDRRVGSSISTSPSSGSRCCYSA